MAALGMGRKMEPTIVAAKIARRRQACGVTPDGIGASAIAKAQSSMTAHLPSVVVRRARVVLRVSVCVSLFSEGVSLILIADCGFRIADFGLMPDE
jgi:hypothetical protein